MSENSVSRKLSEISLRKASLEARIAEEERRRYQEDIDSDQKMRMEDEITRLRRLRGIYSQFEDLLLHVGRSRQYNF
jgi:hypothetical protein